MTLRRRRVTNDERQRLAAARRTQDLAALPARASIGAIEIELRSLGPQPTAAASGEYREAAAG
ncbi:MAG: hypothetical protein M3Q30_22435 [Actinomycetota bacterium]|nr:hypothetical protein [Actinomycetota bacterium]